jgi:acylphosphatase
MTRELPEAAATQGNLVRLDATVHGRVQGVGFRYFIVKRATELGLSGWVANEPDGSVRCVAEGPADAVDALELILRRGPIGSVVDDVRLVRMPGTGRFDGFRVRSGAHGGD